MSFHFALELLTFLVTQVLSVLDAFNMLIDLFVRFLKLISFRGEHIHVVVERIVLLFSLDKAGHNFLD